MFAVFFIASGSDPVNITCSYVSWILSKRLDCNFLKKKSSGFCLKKHLFEVIWDFLYISFGYYDDVIS